MYLPETNSQAGYHRCFRADSSLSSSAAQLVLPVAISRCYLLIQNIGTHLMYLDHGPARLTVTMSGGKVTACTVANAGFGYTLAPTIQFHGGFTPYVAYSTWNGFGLLPAQSPTGLANQGDVSGNVTYNRPAQAHCVMSGGAVSSVVIDDGGYGYINTPEAIVINSPNDPFGCALPSSTSGIVLAAGGTAGIIGSQYALNGTFCHTDQIALIGTSGDYFTVEYAL